MRTELLLSLLLLSAPVLAAKEKAKTSTKDSVPAAAVSKPAQTPAVSAATPPRPVAAPAPVCERCIAAYGDSRSGEDIHKKIVAAILATKPATVLYTGDFVDKGDKTEQWKSSLSITEKLRASTRFYPVFGNHDVGKESGATPFFEAFPALGGQRWYAFDLWNTRFIGLDTESPIAPGTPQYLWLEAKLASRSMTDRAVVFMHDTVFSSGYHGPSEKVAHLPALFEKHKVALVFSGHDHIYERSEKDGVVYIVTGGGGAPLYPKEKKNPYSKVFQSKNHYCLLSISKEAVKVEAFLPDGKKLDEVVIK